MKNIMFKIGFILCIALIAMLIWIFGLLILSYIDYPYSVLAYIAMLCGFIYLSRNEKDGLVSIFKDIHQSNLDDINEHQFEEHIETTNLKNEIQLSLKEIIKNIFGLAIVATVIWIIGLSFGNIKFGDGSYFEFLLVIPLVLVIAFVFIKAFSIIKDMIQKNGDEIQRLN